MMTKLKKILPLIFCCTGLMLSAQTAAPAADAAQKSIYDTVKEQLSALPHRVPGTPEYEKALQIMEKAFADKGIKLNRQYYPTLVPECSKKELIVNGKSVEFFPLAPNNAALISTGEKPVEAPIVYIPNDRLAANNFGHVDGKIVLLDWGEYT
ncbi:MAG: hypothetical protein J6Q65_04495, partial [Lentisphaeria bacterium]|nr:hypothetical protein [Lentisphaeria bacterium]